MLKNLYFRAGAFLATTFLVAIFLAGAAFTATRLATGFLTIALPSTTFSLVTRRGAGRLVPVFTAARFAAAGLSVANRQTRWDYQPKPMGSAQSQPGPAGEARTGSVRESKSTDHDITGC